MTDSQTNVTTNIATLPGLDRLWSKTKGDPQICVAILDGPVDQSHPCFEDADLTRVQTLIADAAGTGIMSGHGTHITSVILGRHGSPVSGIAPDCRGLIVPVFSDKLSRKLSQIDLARGINQAVEAGAHIINISGGQLSQSGEADPILANAVRACNENNVLIVAAAGNDDCECLHVPAALDSVLAVGAMNAQGLPFDFSNWGETYQTQGILAPGEKVLGAKPGGGTTFKSGTSFAAPIVSGIAALLLAIQLQQEEKPDPHAIRKAIIESALPCSPETEPDSRRCLAGHLNILGAYNLISQGDTTIVPEEESVIQLSNETNSLNPSESEVVVLPTPETSEQLAPSAAGVQAAEMVATSETMPSTSSNSGNTMTAMSNNTLVSSVTPSSVQPSGNCGCDGQVAPSAIPGAPSQ
ncbi:MAG: S8 family serine peptidase [Cyanobacteria bacterium SBLK]|nr:S8 family serine peptidase [Cyanobacteria bacterium SBLK]